MSRYLICMTGASGAIYAIRLLAAINKSADAELHLVASRWAERVVVEETGVPLSAHIGAIAPGRVTRHALEDLSAPVSSGSFRLHATVIVPCSIATAGALASGVVQNLIHRAGAVALKEAWPLILVPRESPLSLIALRNLVSLKEAGAHILPASPAFYAKPLTIDNLVDQVVERICERIGVQVPGAHHWKEESEE